MKKGLIFIGAPESGKSRTAWEIKKYFGTKIEYLDGRNFNSKNHFFFESLHEDTKVVVIDDLRVKFPLELFYEMCSGKFIVNRRRKNSLEIEIDKLIVIMDSSLKINVLPTDSSFLGRFDVVEFPHINRESLACEIIKGIEESVVEKAKGGKM